MGAGVYSNRDEMKLRPELVLISLCFPGFCGDFWWDAGSFSQAGKLAQGQLGQLAESLYFQ